MTITKKQCNVTKGTQARQASQVKDGFFGVQTYNVVKL